MLCWCVPVLLFGDPPSTHTQELLNRVQNVASLIKERLLADYPRADVRSALAMFDRRLMLQGFGPLADPYTRRCLLRCVHELAPIPDCEGHLAVLQYNGLLPYMLQLFALGQPLAD